MQAECPLEYAIFHVLHVLISDSLSHYTSVIHNYVTYKMKKGIHLKQHEKCIFAPRIFIPRCYVTINKQTTVSLFLHVPYTLPK